MLRALSPWLLAAALVLPAGAAERVSDAAYGQALFDFYRKDYFGAIVGIEAALSRERLPRDGREAELLLGGMLMSYGLVGRAGDLFERLLDEPLSQEQRDRIWLKLGRQAQQRGQLAQAARAFEQVSEQAPASLLAEVRLRQGLIALARDNPLDALQRLSAPAPGVPLLDLYRRYNRAVSLQLLGRQDEAIGELRAIGQAGGNDAERRAIADRANLAAGYHLLGADQAERAEEFFGRVSLAGDSADSALLGAGWAAANQWRYAAALVPWERLRQSGPGSAGALEARLAVAYAYARLDRLAAAEKAYESAIEGYTAQSRILAEARAAVVGGRLPTAIDSAHQGVAFGELEAGLAGLRGLPGAALYEDLLLDAGFQRELGEYLELRRLQAHLRAKRDDLDAYQTMLEARGQRYDRVLPRIGERLDEVPRARLRQRRDALAERLAAADGADPWSLAQAQERDMRSSLADLQARLGRVPRDDQTLAMRAKLRLLQGVLEWTVDAAAIERRWQARKSLRAVDAELDRLDGHWRALSRADAVAAQRLQALASRLDRQRARLQQLLPRLDAATGVVAGRLARRVLDSLRQTEARLGDYLRQARFGLAELYDQALARQEGRP